MARSSLTAVVLLIVSSIALSAGQSTGQHGYIFLDTPRLGFRDLLKESTSPGMAHVAAVRKKLSAAGEDGYAFQLMSCRGLSLGMLLKRDGLGPRTYQVLAAGDQTELLKALNEAASDGFRLVPGGGKIFNRSEKRWNDRWMAVVAKQSPEERFTYTVLKGTDSATERGLREARERGAVVAASFGHVSGERLVLILEEPEAQKAAPAASGREYRIVATDRTSTLEKEVRAAATLGFRVVADGAMTVVMERDASAPAAGADYKLIGALRPDTLRRELSQAAAEGFRLVCTADHPNEAVLLLERTPDTAGRVEYSIVALGQNSAGEPCARAEADGYRPAVLIDDFVVFERPARRTTLAAAGEADCVSGSCSATPR